MNDKSDKGVEHEKERENKNEVYDIEKTTADYANINATDLTTVQRLYPARPAKMSDVFTCKVLKIS